MAGSDDHARRCQKLFEESAMLRSSAIRSQLMTVRTFCDLAEFEVQREANNEARMILTRIRKALSVIDRHLRKPGHVPRSEFENLAHLYVDLMVRVQRIETALDS